MQQGTTFSAGFSWRSAGRALLIVFAALVLFLQSYAVQSHFHQRQVVSTQTVSHGGNHHRPTGDDADNCPLCHSFYTGQYVAPSLASWFLPLLAVSIIAAASGVSRHYDTVSHNWRGRGPPHI